MKVELLRLQASRRNLGMKMVRMVMARRMNDMIGVVMESLKQHASLMKEMSKEAEIKLVMQIRLMSTRNASIRQMQMIMIRLMRGLQGVVIRSLRANMLEAQWIAKLFAAEEKNSSETTLPSEREKIHAKKQAIQRLRMTLIMITRDELGAVWQTLRDNISNNTRALGSSSQLTRELYFQSRLHRAGIRQIIIAMGNVVRGLPVMALRAMRENKMHERMKRERRHIASNNIKAALLRMLHRDIQGAMQRWIRSLLRQYSHPNS